MQSNSSGFISCEDFKKIKNAGEDFVLIDVREPKEFAAGHIEGAVNIPLNYIDVDAEFVIPNFVTKVIVCCERGGRGQRAAEELAYLGYSDVSNLQGGYSGYCSDMGGR